MKTTRKLLTVALMMATATCVMAQWNTPFWTVEGNANQQDYTIIRFYDHQFSLIKEEKLSGKFLDIRKRRNQKLLDKKLEDVLNMENPVSISRRRGKSLPPKGKV
jgi:hypothetical protein